MTPERLADITAGSAALEVVDGLRKREMSGSTYAACVVRQVLEDLDRKWKVPPVAFAHELARQIADALAREPQFVSELARAIEVQRHAWIGRQVLEELRAAGVCIRIEGGKIRGSGPWQQHLATIKQHRAAIVAALAG